MKESFDTSIKEHIDVFLEIEKREDVKDAIAGAACIIKKSLQSGGAVYLCGNGGSAADAQHIAAEFVGRFQKDRKALSVEALTVNTSSLTAIANDYDYEKVFTRQIEAKGRKGDVLIGISTSGTSRNVINALEYAEENGIHTILLTGNANGNYDERQYECIIRIPSKDTPRIQEAHIFVGHVIAQYVENEIMKES